jgi:hypothetical protein
MRFNIMLTVLWSGILVNRDFTWEETNLYPSLFVSFDVKSLFTNILLQKTVNIILKRIYDDKLISTKS